MKKIIIILATLFVALAINAQSDHFTFMGIPIDGKISAFEKSLKKKGFYPDRQFSILPKEYFTDSRIYVGPFAEEGNVQLLAMFNSETKIVYEVKLIINCYSEIKLTNKYDSFSSNYRDKYITSIIKESKTEAGTGISIIVPDANLNNPIGLIVVTKSIDEIKNQYRLVIQYFDIKNSRKSDAKNLDDL